MEKREMPAKRYGKDKGRFDPLFLRMVKTFIRHYYYPKYHIHVDNSVLKDCPDPYILLFNHPSFYDALFFGASIERNIHYNVAEDYFYKEWLARLLHNHVGCFPKKLFRPTMIS